MNAQQKDRALYDAIIRNLGSGNSVAEAMAKNSQRGGIYIDHARTLRRAQMTLHRWAEEMCNGTIQRDGPEGDGKPFRVREYQRFSAMPGNVGVKHERITYPVPDREAGALRRVAEVCKAAGLHYYHQTDPRGCALYVSTEPLTSSNYNRGVACL